MGLSYPAAGPRCHALSRESYQEYLAQLEGVPTGVMARLVIPVINVDIPIYLGTSEETLMEGVGHLYGTAPPVGGEGTHSVMTAHSGLAEHRMFTDLPELNEGDTFSIETYGEELHYKVIDTAEVLSYETDTLVPENGRDLVTLVTCTPISVNTHRWLVTAEHIALDEAAENPVDSNVPGFPWWALILGAFLMGSVIYLWRNNRVRRHLATDTESARVTSEQLS